MNLLPVQRASQLAAAGPQTQWLVEGLWSDQAVGILGGEPKCCKSFLALDVALSVASGAACLRQFPVRRTGKVLLFPAEDSLAVVRQRLEGIAAAAQVQFESLPIEVITAPTLRLDTPAERQRLTQTVQALRPILLILDPLIRLHRIDENDATQVAALLSYLRELQRQCHLAILLVHHARKDSHSSRPGQALRGSSELQLRKLCGMRTATVCAALEELSQLGEVRRNAKGYQLNGPFPLSRLIAPQGNGNGKSILGSSAG